MSTLLTVCIVTFFSNITNVLSDQVESTAVQVLLTGVTVIQNERNEDFPTATATLAIGDIVLVAERLTVPKGQIDKKKHMVYDFSPSFTRLRMEIWTSTGLLYSIPLVSTVLPRQYWYFLGNAGGCSQLSPLPNGDVNTILASDSDHKNDSQGAQPSFVGSNGFQIYESGNYILRVVGMANSCPFEWTSTISATVGEGSVP